MTKRRIEQFSELCLKSEKMMRDLADEAALLWKVKHSFGAPRAIAATSPISLLLRWCVLALRAEMTQACLYQKRGKGKSMFNDIERGSRHVSLRRQSALAGLITVVGLGIAVLIGGCGSQSTPTTQTGNHPGTSQTTSGNNGTQSTGSSTNKPSSNATVPAGSSITNLKTLDNSVSSSSNALANDQNDANSSASQSQEGESQP